MQLWRGSAFAMEWSVFAVLQMFIITVGVSLAMWLRIRAVNQQNALLREHFEGLEAHQGDVPTDAPPAAPEDWLQAQLAELAEDDVTAPVRRIVLEQTLNPTDDFQQRLGQAVEAAGLLPELDADGTDLHAQIAALETELAAAREGQNTEHAEELKSLLQQFTRDSREMMACIQTLESENAELRELLGDAAPPVKAPPPDDPEESATAQPSAGEEDTVAAGEMDEAELLTAEADVDQASENEAPTTETAA